MGQSRPLLRLFSSFSYSNINYNFNNTNWKTGRWCAWDSNLGPLHGRCRWYYGADAATHVYLSLCFESFVYLFLSIYISMYLSINQSLSHPKVLSLSHKQAKQTQALPPFTWFSFFIRMSVLILPNLSLPFSFNLLHVCKVRYYSLAHILTKE